MARAGIYHSDVKRARDALIAQGRHPSIDAVRAALGNTGSKTTIHRYLREIETEEGAQGLQMSEAIMALVSQLAAQLKIEAGSEVESMRSVLAEREQQFEHSRAEYETKLEESERALTTVSQRLESERNETSRLRDELVAEQVARHTAEQQSRDLRDRLTDAERHQSSLEDKHKHAREALEHFRAAAKEQREQDSRRHEQEVHVLKTELRHAQLSTATKHEELTKLNREAAALISELGSAKQLLYSERDTNRNLSKRIEELHVIETQAVALQAKLDQAQLRIAELELRHDEVVALNEALKERSGSLQMQLAESKLSNSLEERLAKLDQAVFGPDTSS